MNFQNEISRGSISFKKNVKKKPIFMNLKKRFGHIKQPAKLLYYFLREVIKATSINCDLKFSHGGGKRGAGTTDGKSVIVCALEHRFHGRRI